MSTSCARCACLHLCHIFVTSLLHLCYIFATSLLHLCYILLHSLALARCFKGPSKGPKARPLKCRKAGPLKGPKAGPLKGPPAGQTMETLSSDNGDTFVGRCWHIGRSSFMLHATCIHVACNVAFVLDAAVH